MAVLPIVLVVAVAENGVIGVRGGLPWRLKADLRRFREITMGKPLIMGRLTYESIGRALDGRDNIVMSRRAGFAPPGVLPARNLAEAVAMAEACAEARAADEICVIGGAALFGEAIGLAARLHVTHVSGKPEGDAFFRFDAADWTAVARRELPASAGDTASGVYVLYQRRP